MNPDKIKTVEINGRKFQICKMSARTALKVTKILAAKVLPFLESFLGDKMPETDSLDAFLACVPLDDVAKAIDRIDEADLDRLIDYGLTHCYEHLPAGAVQVLTPNGSYGVAGVDDDMLFTLRLLAESIAWSVAGFFDENRWVSMFRGMEILPQQKAATPMKSSSPQSPQGTGNNMKSGTAHTT